MTHTWSVLVGNVGTVYSGSSEEEARRKFAAYVENSEAEYGRASGEWVVMFCDDEIVEEKAPPPLRDEPAKTCRNCNGELVPLLEGGYIHRACFGCTQPEPDDVEEATS